MSFVKCNQFMYLLSFWIRRQNTESDFIGSRYFHICCCTKTASIMLGEGEDYVWAMVFPGRPTTWIKSRLRAYCACSRWSCLFFFSRLPFLISFPLSLGVGSIWTKILSERAVKPPKQSTTKANIPTRFLRLCLLDR